MANAAGSIEQVGTSPTAVPWYLYALAVGATSIIVGVLWDISWHSTIGRDTFWTPAHVAMYLGGVLGGLSSGWLALKTTFAGTAAERAASVPVWGFRAPLGAWVAIWGAIAMLTSAPFDDWWHNAYGLDVEVLSPPHTVLAAGILGIILGSLLLSLAWQNNTSGPAEGRGQALFAYSAGVLVAMFAILVVEYSAPNQQHASLFYRISCGLFPLFLLAAARASKLRWPATTVALIYMLVICTMLWILPLFRAEPMLGPIYNRVTHMVPPAFPLLLVIPAFAIDLLLRRAPGWSDWALAAAVGVVFFTLFLAAQFLFSEFLLSPLSRNWFFGGDRIWSYDARPGPWRYQFWNLSQDPLSLRGLGMALVLAFLSARLGLAWGSWMARVKR
jgi:hypothetical protein